MVFPTPYNTREPFVTYIVETKLYGNYICIQSQSYSVISQFHPVLFLRWKMINCNFRGIIKMCTIFALYAVQYSVRHGRQAGRQKLKLKQHQQCSTRIFTVQNEKIPPTYKQIFILILLCVWAWNLLNRLKNKIKPKKTKTQEHKLGDGLLSRWFGLVWFRFVSENGRGREESRKWMKWKPNRTPHSYGNGRKAKLFSS